MAKSKFPKTNEVKQNDVKETVPGSDIQKPASQSVEAGAAAYGKDARTRATKSPAPKLEAVRSEPRSNVVPINLEDEIRRLAYLLSERRGFVPGYENEDWLTAEREVLQRYRQHSA
jgi:hypothetical protein